MSNVTFIGFMFYKTNSFNQDLSLWDMESVYEFADKVAFINDGIISWYGDTNKIKLSENKILNNFVQGNS